MTCNNDCKNCVFVITKKTLKCQNPNSTCDGTCHKCTFSKEVVVKYVCGKFPKGVW